MAFHLSLELQWIPGPCHCPALIPHLLPLSWKDALQWVPPWGLEQLASSLPEVHGHRVCIDGVGLLPGEFWLELLLGPEYSPPQGAVGGGLTLGGASGLRRSAEKLSGTL